MLVFRHSSVLDWYFCVPKRIKGEADHDQIGTQSSENCNKTTDLFNNSANSPILNILTLTNVFFMPLTSMGNLFSKHSFRDQSKMVKSEETRHSQCQ